MNLVLAVSGATGAYAAKLLIEKSPWPVSLIASDWGREVYNRECSSFEELESLADKVYKNDDLAAAISSGSVETAGMVILPCSTNTLAQIAAGFGDTLITRAAHCHLKESRKLVLCVRESPWTSIDFSNAERVTAAGAVVMPLSPPFYMTSGRDPSEVTMSDLLELFVERVLAALDKPQERTWENCS